MAKSLKYVETKYFYITYESQNKGKLKSMLNGMKIKTKYQNLWDVTKTFIRRTLIALNNHRCHHMQNLSQDDHTFKCKTKTICHFIVYQITLYTSNIYNYICQLSSIKFKKT